MRHLAYSVRYSVVPINSSLLTITLHYSVITTQNIQSLSWPSSTVFDVCVFVISCSSSSLTGKIFPVHIRNADMWSRGIFPFLLNLSLDGRKWSKSHPFRLSPGMRNRYRLNRRLCGPQNRSGRYGEEKIFVNTDRDSNGPACSVVTVRTSV
jgi:hypothetical protein